MYLKAAESLGFKGIGLAKVKVEYLLHHSKKLLENVKSDKYSVICNYFSKNRKIFQD
ncbi:MAG: septal ring lytic transglycosylase RlpA family protein [Candidatus Midichloria sp.]|nr:septal ring lytic transglycosylase RlpA family protein [Candidatus Midichloria sp.]